MNDDRPRNEHHHDGGLASDLQRMVALSNRRQALRMFAGASLIPALGCGGDDGSGVDSGTSNCPNIPEETGGPYPGDGTNGPNVLTQSGIVRSDIRTSFGSLSGTAAGVPLTVELTLVNSGSSCAPLAGYAVYLWHCDRSGFYSLYTIAGQNYLRGVQETDASGKVTFTSIFPACYPGRWPHIHFEIYPTLAKASASSNKVRTSQLALPADVCNTVFATTGYEQSLRNLAMISLTSDMVFSDGSTLQVATATGSVAEGYRSSLVVGVAG